jgi:hypothetical protein
MAPLKTSATSRGGLAGDEGDSTVIRALPPRPIRSEAERDRAIAMVDARAIGNGCHFAGRDAVPVRSGSPAARPGTDSGPCRSPAGDRASGSCHPASVDPARVPSRPRSGSARARRSPAGERRSGSGSVGPHRSAPGRREEPETRSEPRPSGAVALRPTLALRGSARPDPGLPCYLRRPCSIMGEGDLSGVSLLC